MTQLGLLYEKEKIEFGNQKAKEKQRHPVMHQRHGRMYSSPFQGAIRKTRMPGSQYLLAII